MTARFSLPPFSASFPPMPSSAPLSVPSFFARPKFEVMQEEILPRQGVVPPAVEKEELAREKFQQGVVATTTPCLYRHPSSRRAGTSLCRCRSRRPTGERGTSGSSRSQCRRTMLLAQTQTDLEANQTGRSRMPTAKAHPGNPVSGPSASSSFASKSLPDSSGITTT